MEGFRNRKDFFYFVIAKSNNLSVTLDLGRISFHFSASCLPCIHTRKNGQNRVVLVEVSFFSSPTAVWN